MYIVHEGHPFGKLELKTPTLITIEFTCTTLECGEGKKIKNKIQHLKTRLIPTGDESWDLIVDQLFEGGEDFRQVIPVEVGFASLRAFS